MWSIQFSLLLSLLGPQLFHLLNKHILFLKLHPVCPFHNHQISDTSALVHGNAIAHLSRQQLHISPTQISLQFHSNSLQSNPIYTSRQFQKVGAKCLHTFKLLMVNMNVKTCGKCKESNHQVTRHAAGTNCRIKVIKGTNQPSYVETLTPNRQSLQCIKTTHLSKDPTSHRI